MFNADILNDNFILAADSYKVNHYSQIPKGTKWVQSSIVPRKASKHIKKVVVSGIQYLAKYLANVRITQEMVEEAAIETAEQGYEFNREGWERIVNECQGRLPLRVYAMPEGTVMQPGQAIVMIENTHDWAEWLPSYSETIAQCIVWKFTTVASLSKYLHMSIRDFALKTGSNVDMTIFGLHNFGDRGADSPQAAAFAGLAHAMIFSGSDSLKTNSNIKRLYNTKKAYLSSVEATEHSTMCMNSDAKNRNDYGAAVMAVERLEAVVKRVKEKGIGIPIMSVVIDTYDSHRFVRDFLGSPELKARIIQSGGKLVLRPDSGDPLVEPIKILDIAGEVFGFSMNAEGFKELPPYIGVLQGDGINEISIIDIMENCMAAGWATGNLVFGMGGGLTHEAGRDFFSFSQKATAMSTAEKADFLAAWIDLKKEPITDLGKKSLSGYIINILVDGEVKSVNRRFAPFDAQRIETLIFEDGDHFVDSVDFDDVKARAAA